MAPSQGRPPIENPKTERLFIRVTPQEKAEIQSFTKETGYSLLTLIKKGIEAVKKKQSVGGPEKATPTPYCTTPGGLVNLIIPFLPGEIKEEFRMYVCTPLFVPSNLGETELHIGISPGIGRIRNNCELIMDGKFVEGNFNFTGFTQHHKHKEICRIVGKSP